MKADELVKIEEIADKIDYLKSIEEFKEEDFGRFVIVGFNRTRPEKRVGRILQVRKNQGAYNSDMVLIRIADGNILVHENNRYQFIDNPEDISFLNCLFFSYEDIIDTPLSAFDDSDTCVGFLIDE